jgi:hypothetical protein
VLHPEQTESPHWRQWCRRKKKEKEVAHCAQELARTHTAAVREAIA